MTFTEDNFRLSCFEGIRGCRVAVDLAPALYFVLHFICTAAIPYRQKRSSCALSTISLLLLTAAKYWHDWYPAMAPLTVFRKVLAIEETVIRFMNQPDGPAAKLLDACAQPHTGREGLLLMDVDDAIVQDLLAPTTESSEAVCLDECKPSARLHDYVGRAHCVVPAQPIPEVLAHGRNAHELQKLVRCVASYV